MMAVQVRVQGSLEIDDVTAEVLNYMTSYSLLGEFHKRFGQKYTAEQLAVALNRIHWETAVVLRSRKAAAHAAEQQRLAMQEHEPEHSAT